MVSRAAPPLLAVRHNGSESTFATGHDVVIGRDLRADVRIADPRISRAHLILRFEQGKWVAIDDGSANGTFVNGYRGPVIDIHDGQSMNAGGPRLTFEVGPRRAKGGRPPASPPAAQSTMSRSTPAAPVASPAAPIESRRSGVQPLPSLVSQGRRRFWLLDMGMPAGLTVFFACFVRWKIRLRR